MNFSPPIEERSKGELLEIATCQDGSWQDDAIKLAKKELESRKVPQSELNDHIKKRKKGKENYENWQRRKRQQNARDSYSTLSMVGIFFMAPFAILCRLHFGMTIFELRRENFKKKFNQRLILIICGIIFWITFLSIGADRAEKERIKEIEEVDNSDWEKRMIK